MKTEYESDVLVIGGGIAGFFAAVRAREKGCSVVLVDKGITGKSGFTPWANSFCFFDAELGDRREVWLHNVQFASEYLVNLDYYNMFLDDSSARYRDLVGWGFFDDKVDRHLEMPRLLRDKGVTLVQRVMVTDLVLLDGRVAGAMGFHMEREGVILFRSAATILCSGAGAYKAPGYPIHSQTFDGDAMAYRAGASISGKEFVDFHTTGDKYPADAWKMWSEEFAEKIWATPGPGRFQMPIYRPVYTVHEEGPPYMPPQRSFTFPQREGDPRGPALMPLPPEGNMVCGAATGLGVHKSEGVWPVDTQCYSGTPGLYAAGDALASMLCGTIYPNIGTSMSGSAVQGYRAGEEAVASISAVGLVNPARADLEPIERRMLAPLKREKGFDPRWVSEVLLSTMAPYYVLFFKDRLRLEGALENIKFMRQYLTPRLKARDTHELRLAHEVDNMALNAEMKLRASLMRTESRGSHYRMDYPARDDENWLAWILIRQGNNGEMQLSKKEVPESWKLDKGLPYEERYPNRFPGETEYRAKL
jgi:succinate dehydrogenase/fumarate reductase flavoprotein subunit